MNSREAILNRIKSGLKTASHMRADDLSAGEKVKQGITSITPNDTNALWKQFETELKNIAGEFISVKNIEEAGGIISKFISDNNFNRIGISKEDICKTTAEIVLKKQPNLKIIDALELSREERKKELAVTEVSIVHPSFAVADIGSLVFLYDETGTSLPHFLCDNTFVVVNKNQIVANQFDLFDKLDDQKNKNMVFVTGPSRTADIEKVLVLGAHGPRKLTVLLIDNN